MKSILKKILLCGLCLSMATLTAINILHANNKTDDIVEERNELNIEENKYEIDAKLEKTIDNLSEYNCKYISAAINYSIGAFGKEQADDNSESPFTPADDFIVQDNAIYLIHCKQNITGKYVYSTTINKVTKYNTNDQKNVDFMKSLISVGNFWRENYSENQDCSTKEYKENLKTVFGIMGLSYDEIKPLFFTNKKGDDLIDYMLKTVSGSLSPYLEKALQNETTVNTNYTVESKIDREREDFSFDKERNAFRKLVTEEISNKLPSMFENNLEK